MPDYGVDTDAWEPLPWSWAAERLAANRNYWLVTAAGDGRPHVLPLWGVWNDQEHRFAFSCGPRSRKAANLRANPKASIATESTVEALTIEGTAAVVEDDRQGLWIERYLDKYRPFAPGLSAEFIAANLLFEFFPARAFAIIERADEFAERATRWVFI
jgi:Pyridoxamine 5'-phosphate oxidase